MSYRQELLIATEAYCNNLKTEIERLSIEYEQMCRLADVYKNATTDTEVRKVDDAISSENRKIKLKLDKKPINHYECCSQQNKKALGDLRKAYRQMSNQLSKANSEKSALETGCYTTWVDMTNPVVHEFSDNDAKWVKNIVKSINS